MIKHIIQNSKLSILAVVLGVGIIFGGSSLTSFNHGHSEAESKIAQDLIIKNEVKSIEIIQLERKEDYVQVLFKNNSIHKITAFVIGQTKRTRTVVELAEDKEVLPGHTHSERFGIPQSSQPLEISLLAFIFDDNHGEGNPINIKEVLDIRLGKKIQNERILTHLQQLSEISNEKLAVSFYSMKKVVENLPTEIDKGTSEFIKIGLHNAKESALQDIERLNNLINNGHYVEMKQRLIELNMAYQKKIAK